jgi:hypothetical protein
MLARGNNGDGVEIVQGSASLSGTSTNPSVISANTGSGVRVASGDGNIFLSKIGVNANATAKLGNGGDGIAIENVPNLQLFGNTIGGNAGAGIKITGASATGNVIIGNSIGTASLGGIVNLGNNGNGITITGGAQNEIIGAATLSSSDLNAIVFNGGGGVSSDSCVRLLFNQIHDNADDAVGGGGFFNPNATLTLTTTTLPDEKDVRIKVDDPAHPSTEETFFIFLNDAPGTDVQQPIGSKVLTTDGAGKADVTVRLTGQFATLPFPTFFAVTDATSVPNTSCTSIVIQGGRRHDPAAGFGMNTNGT